jgi:hypothetical protein
MMAKAFRQVLQQASSLPIQTQHDFLAKILDEWMGTEEHQIDDILVIGFKLS